MPAAAVPNPPWADDTWSETAWEEGTWGVTLVAEPITTRARGVIVKPGSSARDVTVAPAASGKGVLVS